MAGEGVILSTISMARLRSSPVIVRVDLPGSLDGVSSWVVTSPSMRTLGMPLRVAIIITRVVIGSKYPAGNRVVKIKKILDMLKVTWKPLQSLLLVTWILVSESIRTFGAIT